jgi:L-lysine exporter family protein LysE/ArgO
MRQHVFILCLICAASDALLIAAGVAGLGTIIKQSPVLLTAIRLGGAAFLFWYAVVALRRAMNPEAMKLADEGEGSLSAAIATCLAFTFLNPHVYLDTVLLVGSLSAQFEGNARVAYGVGAMLASFIWFFSLGYGARLLAPIFQKQRAWQVLDLFIAAVMCLLAILLLVPFFLDA